MLLGAVLLREYRRAALEERSYAARLLQDEFGELELTREQSLKLSNECPIPPLPAKIFSQ